jgi:integral membrane protein
MNLKTKLGFLRILALFEGITLLLFPITMYLKSANEMPMPNRILGTIHGALFIIYSIWLLVVAKEKKWSIGKIALSFFASFVPFGTFVIDHYIFKKAQ